MVTKIVITLFGAPVVTRLKDVSVAYISLAILYSYHSIHIHYIYIFIYTYTVVYPIYLKEYISVVDLPQKDFRNIGRC